MLDRIVAWLGRTAWERAVRVSGVLFVALVLLWLGRDDPWPLLLLWVGFAVTVSGIHRIYPKAGAPAFMPGGLLVVLGLAICAVAEAWDGRPGWFGFMLAAFAIIVVARHRWATAPKAA